MVATLRWTSKFPLANGLCWNALVLQHTRSFSVRDMLTGISESAFDLYSLANAELALLTKVKLDLRYVIVQKLRCVAYFWFHQ